MIICAISDNHRQRPATLPKADLLIHSGDMGSRGDQEELSEELLWLTQIKEQFPLGILYVPGNHDIAMDRNFAKESWERWTRDPRSSFYMPRPYGSADEILEKFAEAGIKVLIDEALEIEGVKIYGSPYTPTFFNWAFMSSEAKLAERWEKIPNDTELLITHGPAQGLRDLCSSGYAGSASLRWLVDTGLPNLKAHVFGHIHEGAGAGEVTRDQGNYVCWNASVLDGNYRGFNPIYTLDTNGWEIAGE